MNAFRLGIVEGFYGKPWTWREREQAAEFMAANGYRTYLYAPKGDEFLRRRWREPWPEKTLHELRNLSACFRRLGLSFGVGLSPIDYDEDLIKKKIDEIISLDVDHIAILFDDMKGDVPELAGAQVKLVHAVAARWRHGRLSMCPTYYSLDPVLDRIFGLRPPEYLHELGQSLDSAVEIFWTGERICSQSYSTAHLEQIGAVLGRRPLLWDNYPVNDTETMSKVLHLRPFTGRPGALSAHLSGHLINPMLQPVLSRVPALTLVESYRQGKAYSADQAFHSAAVAVLGKQLAACIERDVVLFQDLGLGKIDPQIVSALRAEYSTIAHPAAAEVVGWLDGAYTVTHEVVLGQQ
ncbi:MAG: beta-N-acetylglucosaminidase domain-containing protein [Deltaproteobacteria bacterium]|nr:beta-N-acetylglucosaminidase domain-containing protein [Deltaproteobacteria bacterium]